MATIKVAQIFFPPLSPFPNIRQICNKQILPVVHEEPEPGHENKALLEAFCRVNILQLPAPGTFIDGLEAVCKSRGSAEQGSFEERGSQIRRSLRFSFHPTGIFKLFLLLRTLQGHSNHTSSKLLDFAFCAPKASGRGFILSSKYVASTPFCLVHL